MSDIIAAVTGAVVASILGFIAFQYQQHRGNIVVVERLLQSPQINFSNAIDKKLEIIYNGNKVKNLVLTHFVIFNQGSNTVKPLKLTVKITPKSENFTYAELNVSDPNEIATWKMDNETGTFEIERPYLNSLKKYKEEKIDVSLFSDVLLDFSVNGGGEDWGCKVVNSDLGKKRINKFLYVGMIIFTIISYFIIAYNIMLNYIKHFTELSSIEKIIIPVLYGMLFVFFYFILKKLFRRIYKSE
ncbi:MAG TPA: hypothetical protein PKX58_11305 [Flexilinea sp.]|nr:hypothetical protein [Flexilinea sp.]HPJ65771.1 hypothetical protein [Flexilinea sp.]HPR71225.1 hypothetical protein [Flexilinea sp.]